MCATEDRFVDGFSMGQKIALRLLLVSFLAVAVFAVFKQSAIWGWIYLGFATVGQFVLILPTLCGHCPYPHRHNDCLLVPASVMKTVVPYRGLRIPSAEKGALYVAVAGLVLIPQYWLFQEPLLFILFLALILPFFGFFQFYMCRHCRHTGCPANRAS
jgi:hypothetical protein